MIGVELLRTSLNTRGVYYGVDLGTSYTVVAKIDVDDMQDGALERLPVKFIQIDQSSPLLNDTVEASDMVASIYAVGADGNQYVGNRLYKLKANPGFVKDKNIFYHWKLDLGVSVKPLYKDAVRPDADDASKVAGKILNYCRLKSIGKADWENVIITVPASFQANQRADVLEAARYASVVASEQMLVDEPNAAFLGYLNQIGFQKVSDLLGNGQVKVLVIDFGGGTCDLSALTCDLVQNELAISNVAISRYNDLGGQDIDMILAEKYLLPGFIEQHNLDNLDTEEIEDVLMPQLAVIAEKLKIELCQKVAAAIASYDELNEDFLKTFVGELKDQQVQLDSDTFDLPKIILSAQDLYSVTSALFRQDDYQFSVVDKVIQTIPGVVTGILQKANWRKDEVSHVLLVGGSVQNPLFIKRTMDLMEDSAVVVPRQPDRLVAAGAAIYSFYQYALNKSVIKPICSETIGVIMANEDFFPLVESGAQLPFKAVLPNFALQSDYQTMIEIPFCLNHKDNVVGILRCAISEVVTKDDAVEVEMSYSTDKVIDAVVKINQTQMGRVTIARPMDPVSMTPEERKVADAARQLEAARLAGDMSTERSVLRNLIWDFYGVSNYSRAIAAALEYNKKFDNVDPFVWNMLYLSYGRLGQKGKAEEAMKRGLEMAPNNRVLIYNNSLSIGDQEGDARALAYLQEQHPDVRRYKDIYYRMAILAHKTGDERAAAEVVARFEEGKEQPSCEFDANLLNQVLSIAGSKQRCNVDRFNNDVEDAGLGSLFDSGSLLKVKA